MADAPTLSVNVKTQCVCVCARVGVVGLVRVRVRLTLKQIPFIAHMLQETEPDLGPFFGP